MIGVAAASFLRRRLADLIAAGTVKDLVVPRPIQVDGNPGSLALQLDDATDLVFCANHDLVPTLKSGLVDWSKVTRVKLLEVRTR